MLKGYRSHFPSLLLAATAGVAVRKMGLSPQLPQRSWYIKVVDLKVLYILTLKPALCSTNRPQHDKYIQLKYRANDPLRHADLSDA